MPTPGNPLDVVHSIAGERQEVCDLLRYDTEHVTHLFIANLSLAGEVPENVVLAHELGEILVATDDCRRPVHGSTMLDKRITYKNG